VRHNYHYPLTLLLLAALASASALAERTRDLGRFVVHYTAMPTGALDERVASAYAIERAADMGTLNVAVAKKQPGGKTTPVTATITADVSDHLGNINMLSIREIHDGEAVYYIGEFQIRSRHPLQFQITVSPEGAGPPYVLKFEKQFMLK
jgi:hypothetical protein